MNAAHSLQRTGRSVAHRGGRWLRASLAGLALATVCGVAQAVAAAPLTPVELGEEPIFRHSSPVGEITYTPGRGLHIGDTGLTLGGFFHLTDQHPDGEVDEVELDDVSLFVIWDPHPRLHFFSEIEYGDVFRIDQHGNLGSPRDKLTADRLYGDFLGTDLINLRVGIFRTPVGRWNVIHAPPLVWTTEQPIVTEVPFDPNLTGVMLFGSLFRRGGVLAYSLYDQFAGPLENNPDFDPADHSTGARLEYTADSGWSVGASYLAAKRDGDWRHLGGADFLWSRGRFEIMAELTAVAGRGRKGEGGGYVQTVFGITDRIFLVQRFEHFVHADEGPRHVNLITLGVAYRPFPAVVLKAEYLITDKLDPEEPSGFYASIATLF